MRILIVDDSKTKCVWIKEILKQRNIEYEEIFYLSGAYQKILSKKIYDGIILDMQFPILMDSIVDGRAGILLLKKLKNKNIYIPVLGNSTINFPSSEEYPFLKGKIEGYETLDGRNTLLEFLKSIEEQPI